MFVWHKLACLFRRPLAQECKAYPFRNVQAQVDCIALCVDVAFALQIQISVDYFQVLAIFTSARVEWPPIIRDAFKVRHSSQHFPVCVRAATFKVAVFGFVFSTPVVLHLGASSLSSQFMSAFNLNLELAAPECLSPDLDYEQKFLGIVGLPLCALALLAVVALAGYLWNTLIKRSKKGQRQNHVPALIGASVLLMLFIYMQETKTALDGELAPRRAVSLAMPASSRPPATMSHGPNGATSMGA